MEEKTQDKYQEPVEGESGTLKESSESGSWPGSEGAEALSAERAGIPKKEVLESAQETGIEKKPASEPKKEKAEKIEEVLEEAVSKEPPSAKIKEKIEQLKALDQQNQVRALMDLAFQKDLDFAVEVAKGLDNAYVLDEFHKKLTADDSYQKLVEKEKLKKL